MIESADVILWGTRIGCVVRRDGVPYAEFEYVPDFIGCGIEPSPIEMPVASRVYKFPSLPYASFHGLPGMLSDSDANARTAAKTASATLAQCREPFI